MKFIGAGARPEQPRIHHDAVFTVPNVLTVLRFLGVPLFIWLVLGPREYGYGALVLAIMAGTDWVDGYIARRFDQMSNLGRVMDPIADRAALIAVAVTLVIAGLVEWWYLAALLVPDAALLALSLYYFRGHPDLPVSFIGKIRTGLLLVGTPLLVLSKLPVPAAEIYAVAAWLFLVPGLVGHWIAGFSYLRAILRKGRRLGTGTSSGADGPDGADDGGRH